MNHARVIVNPASGAGKTKKIFPQIKHYLSEMSLPFDFDITEAPGHAIELAREAVQKGYEMMVSVGGDGTLNEVVNGLYQSGSIRDVTLGVIATGTGSDFIRTVDIPRIYREACRRLVAPKKLKLDLGMIEFGENGRTSRRVFTNFAGLGFDARIVKATPKTIKVLGGKPSYLVGLLNTLLFYRNVEISLTVDGRIEKKKVCTVIVSNGRFGGGGMLISPQADLKDGWLDATIIDDIGKLDLLGSLPRIYKGTHLTHPKVSVMKVKEVFIDTDDSIYLQADGELLGKAPVRFQVLPALLNLAT